MSDLMPWMAPWSGRTLALLLLAAGLILTCRALFPRKDTRPRCPKCYYDLTGGTAQSCPECGHAPIHRDRPGKVRRHYKTALLGLLIAIALPIFVVQRRVRVFGWKYYSYYGPVYYLLPKERVQYEKIGDYEIGVYRDRRWWNIVDATAILTLHSNTLWKGEADRWSIRDPAPYGHNIDPGTDLTGDGTPDLILVAGTGGAHGCKTYTIFELRDTSAQLLTVIDSGNSDVRFEDLDLDGDYEAVFHDDTFAYWNTSFASSPMPRVVLAYDGTTYTLAPDLMAAPPPPPEQWSKLVQEVHQSLSDNDQLWQSSALWATMLDLTYTGHSDLARQFLDESWPTDRPGKEQFAKDFRLQLQASPYWHGLAKRTPRADPSE